MLCLFQYKYNTFLSLFNNTMSPPSPFIHPLSQHLTTHPLPQTLCIMATLFISNVILFIGTVHTKFMGVFLNTIHGFCSSVLFPALFTATWLIDWIWCLFFFIVIRVDSLSQLFPLFIMWVVDFIMLCQVMKTVLVLYFRIHYWCCLRWILCYLVLTFWFLADYWVFAPHFEVVYLSITSILCIKWQKVCP